MLLPLFWLLLVACGTDRAGLLPADQATAPPGEAPTTPASTISTLSSAVPTGPLPPRVETYYPSPGEEVPSGAQLRWVFDQPIDPDSFSQALRIAPAIEGTLDWADERTAVFTPVSIATGTRYRVSLATTVVADTGLALTEGLDYSFSALAPLQVTRVTPSPGAIDLRSDTHLVLEFNHPIVPVDCIGAPVSQQEGGCAALPLAFAPSVMGSGRWVTTSRYVFTPLLGFAAGQTYEVTLPADVVSASGAALSEAYVWSFGTAEPRVEQLTPEPGAVNVPIDTELRVVFNTPMDRDVTAGDLVVSTEAGELISGTVTWFDGGAELAFRPSAPLALDTTFQVRIGPRARAVGSAPLMAQDAWAFRTAPAPRLIDHVPGDGATGVAIHASVRLTFVGAMSEESLRSGVRVTSTQASHEFFGVYDEASGVYHLSWERSPRTEYCVVAAATITDHYGNTLGEPSRFCFETGDLPAMVEPAITSEAVTLDAGRPAALAFLSRNVDAVALTLSRSDVTTFLQQRFDQGEVLRNWVAAMDAAPNTVTPTRVALQPLDGMLPTGLYYLSWDLVGAAISERHLPVAVIDRHVMLKISDHEALVWVTDLASGMPITRTEVQVLDQEGLLIAGGTTDMDGLARLPIADHDDGSLWRTLAAVTGRPGETGFGIALTTWQGGASPWQFDIPMDLGPQGRYRAFLLTDRAVYRAGQRVRVAGWLREEVNGAYQLPQTALTATLALRGDRGHLAEALEILISDDGRFDHEIRLSDTLSSGGYSLSLLSPIADGDEFMTLANVGIEVMPYRKPAYRVDVEPAEDAVLRGGDVEISIEAAYYAGGFPVGAQVAWAIYAEPYQLELADGQPNVGNRWIWHAPHRGGGRTAVAEGLGTLDAHGRLLLKLPAELVPLSEEGLAVSQQWTIEAMVTDLSGFPVFGSSAVIVHNTDVYVGLRSASGVVRPRERLAVDLRVVDWDGEPVPAHQVALQLARRTWYPRATSATWGYTDTLISEQNLETGVDGLAQAAFTAPRSGLYVVKATTVTATGLHADNEIGFWIGGNEGDGWRTDGQQLALVADADLYRVGDVARVLIPVAGAGPHRVLLTLERNGVILTEHHVFDTPNPILEIPILDTYAPNVYVSCMVIQPATETAPAQALFGYTELIVDVSPRLLSVDVVVEDRSYDPGEPVTLSVRARDHQGTPVAANVIVAVVDQAVTTLAEQERPVLMDVFYGRQPLRVVTGDGLLAAGDVSANALSWRGHLGLGASAPAGMGRVDDGGGVTPRRNFADTAYWAIDLSTDASGFATAVFTLPDSLTEWDVRAWAATPDSLFGEGEATLIASKPLSLRPVTPRFLVAGDTVELATIVHNTTDEQMAVQVSLTAETGLQLISPAMKEVMIRAGGVERVAWQATVVQTPERVAQMTFAVESGAYADASRPTYGTSGMDGLPILDETVSDVFGFSGGVAPGSAAIEVVDVPDEARSGSTLLIQLAPRPQDHLSGALVSQQPCDGAVDACANELLALVSGYGAVAPTSDRSLQAAAAIDGALDWIDVHQNADGGWGWWREMSNLHLTSHVVFVLQRAQMAGFAVSAESMHAALSYVSETVARGIDAELRHAHFALGLRVLSDAGWPWPQGAGSALYADRQALGLQGRAHLAMAYGLADASDPRITTLLDEIRGAAVVRGTAVHWEEIDQEQWTTNVQLTAIVVDLLVALDPDATEIAPAIWWLLGARQGAGGETNYERAWVLTALADYVGLDATLNGELTSFEVTVNGQPVPLTLSADDRWAAPIARLPLGDRDDAPGPLRRGANLVEIAYGSGSKTSLTYRGMLDLILPVDDEMVGQSRGLTISRWYCDPSMAMALDPASRRCEPVQRVGKGELVAVQLSLTVPETRYFVEVTDLYPAGFEVVEETLGYGASGGTSDHAAARTDAASSPLRPVTMGDSAISFLAEALPPGTYEVFYMLRATVPGRYRALPAIARERFFPEVGGRSAGHFLEIERELAD